MKPTPAQIEAAKAKVIAAADIVNRHNVGVAQTCAQLNGSNLYRDYMIDNQPAGARELDEAFQELFTLTAAAQVGENKSAYVEALNYAHAYDRGWKEATAAAQVGGGNCILPPDHSGPCVTARRAGRGARGGRSSCSHMGDQ